MSIPVSIKASFTEDRSGTRFEATGPFQKSNLQDVKALFTQFRPDFSSYSGFAHDGVRFSTNNGTFNYFVLFNTSRLTYEQEKSITSALNNLCLQIRELDGRNLLVQPLLVEKKPSPEPAQNIAEITIRETQSDLYFDVTGPLVPSALDMYVETAENLRRRIYFCFNKGSFQVNEDQTKFHLFFHLSLTQNGKSQIKEAKNIANLTIASKLKEKGLATNSSVKEGFTALRPYHSRLIEFAEHIGSPLQSRLKVEQRLVTIYFSTPLLVLENYLS